MRTRASINKKIVLAQQWAIDVGFGPSAVMAGWSGGRLRKAAPEAWSVVLGRERVDPGSGKPHGRKRREKKKTIM